ncbi:hypothetical protein N7533_010758 [Penicillium manginii]|uniref:uncharacterized protein n=1 Tax=Penicillium manginii TaxID=203109 RepID=UPI00254664C2|nr:uncharacterized protein N7533_010758 [Penicillium manginii]KAJ5741349.1 hypothetical protein N7533_010758 [Penicillium manginii]
MATTTGLDYLRSRTVVDCDTADIEVARSLGPFQHSTSNQAIILGELLKPSSAEIVASAKVDAKVLHPKFSSISVEELAVEIGIVRLAVRMSGHVKGTVLVQTNPYYSYSQEKTIVNALRLVQLFQHVQPGFDITRIAIKIPSTWEGMMACHTLELAGVRTLGTMLFTMTQAVLAAEVGCTYISPYVNELRAHLQEGFVDHAKLLPLCRAIQEYYKSINANTQVLGASLTSTEEIYSLAGIDRLTISPPLLEQLSTQAAPVNAPSLFDAAPTTPLPAPGTSYLNDSGKFQITFTRDLNGASNVKLIEAVNAFCGFQDKLVQLMS